MAGFVKVVIFLFPRRRPCWSSKVVLHGLVNLLRFLVVAWAALLSFEILGVLFVEPFNFNGVVLFALLIWLGFAFLVGGLSGFPCLRPFVYAVLGNF